MMTNNEKVIRHYNWLGFQERCRVIYRYQKREKATVRDVAEAFCMSIGQAHRMIQEGREFYEPGQ